MRKLFSLRLNTFLCASVTGLVALLRFTPSFPIAPVVLASCSAIVAAAPLGAATADAKQNYDLPRGDAATTLRQFAAIAGRSLVFVTDKVRGETTNPVRGEFTPREALEGMLAGSALEAAQDAATGALVVSRKRPAPAQQEHEESERSRGPPAGSPAPPPETPKTNQPKHNESLPVKPRNLLTFLTAWLYASTVAVGAQTTGAIEGRIFNATNSSALANVRVSLPDVSRDTVTDRSGFFRFAEVPPGELRVVVSYFGMSSQNATVLVPVGGSVERNFELSPSESLKKGEVVKLDAFKVVSDREMSSQAIATNERRNSANIKEVVSFGEFGERGSENIGEFLKYLPGVSLDPDGAGSFESVAVRGIPASNVGVLVDGTSIAGSSLDNSRAISLRTVPMANVSRVEVTKVPTPDIPASNIGGTINLISGSPFDKQKAEYSYQSYFQFSNYSGITLKGTRQWQLPENTSKYTDPSVEFRATVPVNSNLAFNAAVVRTYRQNVSPDRQANWDLVRNVFTNGAWGELTNPAMTLSGQAGVEWRISPRDSLSLSYNQRKFERPTTRSQLTFNFGAGADGDATYTQGAPTALGTVSQGNNWRIEHLDTSQGSLKYRHIGSDWKLNISGAWSESSASQDDISAGFFASANASITGLVMRGDGIGEGGSIIPARISARTNTGSVVDIYDGANYSLLNGTGAEYLRKGASKNGQIDLSRDFNRVVPITIKVGAYINREKRDARTFSKTWNFRPNGAADVTSRLAGKFDFFDEAFLANPPKILGIPYRTISHKKAYELFKQRPDWFVLDNAQEYQSAVQGSRFYDETISAGYVRGDVRLFEKRLWIATGIRFEKTKGDGQGPLDDINAQFQRDASGTFIRDSAGNRVLITTDALARNRLRYQDRAARSSTRYDDLYPSLNASYDLSEKWVLRGAFAKTVGRPNVNFITPGITISDPDIVDPRITVSNSSLKPWTANNYDLSLEWYNSGVSSIGVFRKNITDFFGNIVTAATPALLTQYGLDDDPALLRYSIATTRNVGDARLTGVEFSHRQSLTFLPHWARGLQVFVNATKLKVEGSSTADFQGFSPETGSAGFSFVRGRFFLKGNWSYQSLTRTNIVATSARIPANTYAYVDRILKGSVSAEYVFSRRFSIYGALSDLRPPMRKTLQYAPTTPDYAKPVRYLGAGYSTTIGVKGTF
jgi:iron complex outermembrane receptor protein